MFAFCIFSENRTTGEVTAFAARDPVGIKLLYMGRAKCGGGGEDGNGAAGGRGDTCFRRK